MTVSIIHKTNGTDGTNGGPNETATTSTPMSGATKLCQKLRETSSLIVCPGVYDGLSARIALNLGFEAMYMVRISNSIRLSTPSNFSRLVREQRLRGWESRI